VSTVGAWRSSHADLDRLDLDVLLGHTLKLARSQLIAFPERTLSCADQENLNNSVQRLRQGEPIAYITGHKEFYSLDFTVSPAVLIPRSDTECLVEAALARLSSADRVLDLGTGSGIIGICLARYGNVRVSASDESDAAVDIARENARRLGVDMEFLLGNWFEPVTGRYSMIVSNPPYIAANDAHLPALNYEPSQALISGPCGLNDLEHICHKASGYLLRHGWLLLEHGSDQSASVRALLTDSGFTEICTLRDLSGHERVTAGQWPG
jgi:release factor glutamine methyltransferase